MIFNICAVLTHIKNIEYTYKISYKNGGKNTPKI